MAPRADARLTHLCIGTNPVRAMVREESDRVSDISETGSIRLRCQQSPKADTTVPIRRLHVYEDICALHTSPDPHIHIHQIAGKKKPGNPHLRGPSGFSKPPKMVGRVGFEPTTNWLKANCSTNLANDPLCGGAYNTDF